MNEFLSRVFDKAVISLSIRFPSDQMNDKQMYSYCKQTLEGKNQSTTDPSLSVFFPHMTITASHHQVAFCSFYSNLAQNSS